MGEPHVEERPAGERRRAGRGLPQQAAERVEIGGRRRRFTGNQLRRHVVRCAERSSALRQLRPLDARRQAEVGHVGDAPAVEEDVRGLQVAVDDAARVQCVEPAGHVLGETRCGGKLERALAQSGGEAPACEARHRQPEPAVRLAVRQHRHEA